MRDYNSVLKSMRICLAVDRDSNCLSECFGCDYINHDHHVMDMVRDAADAIEELLAVVPQWVSVEERLPEKWKHCLLRFKNNNDSWGGIELGYLASDGKTWGDANHTITHWMYLPEPPKEVEYG